MEITEMVKKKIPVEVWEGLEEAEGCVELAVTMSLTVNLSHASAQVAFEKDTVAVTEMVRDLLENGSNVIPTITNIKVIRFHNNS